MARIFLALLVYMLAGCASLTETQCRGDEAQWEWLGEYDAVQGDQPWIEAYAQVCRPFGVIVPQQAYLKGWDTGHAEFERRVEIGD